MSYSADKPSPRGPDDPRSLDEMLPPVHAPDAAFLLQLFLIPMIIVSIIVLVWLLFSWLAHMGSNPRDLVRDLGSASDLAWQKAESLSEMMRHPANDALKDDVELTRDLTRVLEEQVAAARMDQRHVHMRVFLCRALGEFRTKEAVPALITAARTDRNEAEGDVRDAALQALAVLASNLARKFGVDEVQQDEQLMELLLAASREQADQPDESRRRAEVRSVAAFALGVVGGERALDRLAILLSDAYPNTRFNAAMGLARHGDARCAATLVEMLDPENSAMLQGETSDSERELKRGLVLSNAMRAAEQLARHNDTDDLSALKRALEELARSRQPAAIRGQAVETRSRFR